MRTPLAVLLMGLALAACGGSSSSGWKDLQSVRVTVAQPGLPPPFGTPKTTAFTTAAELKRVTAELNAHHITKASSASADSGCAGGFKIAIAIEQQGSAPVNLNAYRCANRTSGNVSGDLVGFLNAVGVKL
ncbi:MAG TPA: hypothetical protein VGH24_07160 [Solirubrobacteraceae bacterium]